MSRAHTNAQAAQPRDGAVFTVNLYGVLLCFTVNSCPRAARYFTVTPTGRLWVVERPTGPIPARPVTRNTPAWASPKRPVEVERVVDSEPVVAGRPDVTRRRLMLRRTCQ